MFLLLFIHLQHSLDESNKEQGEYRVAFPYQTLALQALAYDTNQLFVSLRVHISVPDNGDESFFNKIKISQVTLKVKKKRLFPREDVHYEVSFFYCFCRSFESWMKWYVVLKSSYKKR